MTMPAGSGVETARRLLDRRRRELFKPFPKALLGDVDAVHDLRVAVRRLRAGLGLLVAKPGSKPARRADHRLRTLARAAGTGRDMDVAAEVLATLAPARAATRPDWKALVKSLDGTRARARRGTREALLDLPVAGLRADLRRVEAIDAGFPEQLPERIRALIDHEGGRLLARLTETGRRFDPAALHEIRRRARRLRYAAEIADALVGRDSGAPKAWRSLQNRLGNIHDRHMLAEWLKKRAARAESRGRPGLATAARGAARRAIGDARRRHRALLADDPATLVRAALRAMAPPERPAGDRRPGVVLRFPPAAATK